MILVANWGANYNPDNRVRNLIPKILTWIDTHLPNALFIFRSSNMAHNSCESYSIPDNIQHKPADNPQHPEWYWKAFPLQNTIWEDIITQPAHIGKIFMDILPMSMKRPDQHPGGDDCLHYCVPGPIDTWMLLLYSILFEIHQL